jgi:DNA-binding PadR family transcriptional regulator
MSDFDLVEQLHKKAIKNFVDVLILSEMKGKFLSGYDIIALFHNRFGILLSSGTVYSTLYSLERRGLIQGVWNDRKRVYELTETTERNMNTLTRAGKEIQDFLRNISLIDSQNGTYTISDAQHSTGHIRKGV